MTYSYCQNMSCNADMRGASFAARIITVIVSIALAMLICVFGLLLPLLVTVLGVLLVLVVGKNGICPRR